MELREGYKNTDVGVIPKEWEVHLLKDEIASLKAGISVNSNNEIIDIADDYAILKTSCVSNGSFLPFEAKKIISNDKHRAKLNPLKDHIIISRMNTPDLVGECGYVNSDYPNLFLPDRLWMIEFKKSRKINALWLNYILNYSTYRQKIRDIGTGTSGSMKNISKGKLLEISIPYPSENEQNSIAAALSDADALISSLEKLIAKKQNIKKGAMQELFSNDELLIVNGELSNEKLGDLLDYEQPTEYLVTDTEYNDNNQTPVLTAGKTFILGYTNEEFGIFNKLPVIIFDDFTTDIKYVDFPFKVKSSAMKILMPSNPNVNLRYIFKKMQTLNFQVGDHKRHWI